MARSSLPPRNRSRRQPPPPEAAGEISAHDRMIWAPPRGVPMAGQPMPEAVRVFEHAMTSLQGHDYRGALAHFEDLLERFSGERALLDRARVYATVCRRELGRTHARTPTTIEERLTATTAALNNGENQRAEQLVSQVIDEAPGHELGHYLLAVVHARRGATAAALDALERAIVLSPEVRAQARHDVDFEGLRGQETFERLMAGAAARSGTRR